MPDPLWTVDDLAAYLALKPGTVRNRASADPDSLPPPVRGLPRRWEPSVVQAWAVEQSAPVRRAGRPRAVA